MNEFNLTDKQKRLLKNALRYELIRESNKPITIFYNEVLADAIIIAQQNKLDFDFIDELKNMS